MGRNGLITAGSPRYPHVVSLRVAGLIFAQTFALLPLAYMVLVGTLQSIDPSLEENAKNLGASPFQVFRTVTLPMATPGIAASMLVVFVQSMWILAIASHAGDFHVSRPGFTSSSSVGLRHSGRAALAVLLLIPSIVAFLVQKLWTERRSTSA